ncbi:unnamed protein product [Amoebophrya sp. A120]|nr:unnamed protein product [Amoebophrya sp. A120]|eukprot:GSA120T00004131001.1
MPAPDGPGRLQPVGSHARLIGDALSRFCGEERGNHRPWALVVDYIERRSDDDFEGDDDGCLFYVITCCSCRGPPPRVSGSEVTPLFTVHQVNGGKLRTAMEAFQHIVNPDPPALLAVAHMEHMGYVRNWLQTRIRDNADHVRETYFPSTEVGRLRQQLVSKSEAVAFTTAEACAEYLVGYSRKSSEVAKIRTFCVDIGTETVKSDVYRTEPERMPLDDMSCILRPLRMVEASRSVAGRNRGIDHEARIR